MSEYNKGQPTEPVKVELTGQLWGDVESLIEYFRSIVAMLSLEEQQQLAYPAQPRTDEEAKELLKKLKLSYQEKTGNK